MDEHPTLPCPPPDEHPTLRSPSMAGAAQPSVPRDGKPVVVTAPSPRPGLVPTSRRSTRRASDSRLLKALEEVPRHLFAPDEADRETPSDRAMQLGRRRSIPPVGVVAMMLGALDLNGTERVLDIGGGGGYQAALIGRLAREVVSVEVDDYLVRRPTSVLHGLGWPIVRVIHSEDGASWSDGAPYQAIFVGGAISELPFALLDQLDVGGRLVVPLGDARAQLVTRLRKRIDGFDSETICACHVDMLVTSCSRASSFPWTNRRTA